MANGNKIEIKVAATGGDQASAEIRKLEAALGIVEKSEKELAKNRAMFLSAAEAEVAEVERLVASTKKLEAANTNLVDTGSKVTKQAVSMKTDWKNVGYQVQDVAVQVGAGTSAFQALGQQLPQLLSGFGPMGILLGTVSAVALPLAGVLFNLGNAAEGAGEKADEAADKLEKLTEKRAEKSATAAADDLLSFRIALDDETIAYKRQNDEIQRTIDLLQAKRRAQAEVDSADAALALAKIDASDAPETEKIKARAKVQEELERKRFEDRKAEAGERVNASYNRATGATGDATLARSKEAAERQRLEDQQSEANALRSKITAANAANAALPDIEKKIQESSTPIPFIPGQGNLTEKLEAQRVTELKKLEEERDKLASISGAASGSDRARLEQLTGKGDGSNADLQKSIQGLTKAAEALEEAARKAQGDYGATREIETAKLGGDFEATKRRLETNRITTGTAAERAAAQEREREERKADQLRDKAAAEANKASGAAGRAGRLAEGLVPDNAPAAARKKLEEISDGLQNGDQGGEVEKLLVAVEQLAAFVKNRGDGKGNGRDLSRRIEILEQQIRGK